MVRPCRSDWQPVGLCSWKAALEIVFTILKIQWHFMGGGTWGHTSRGASPPLGRAISVPAATWGLLSAQKEAFRPPSPQKDFLGLPEAENSHSGFWLKMGCYSFWLLKIDSLRRLSKTLETASTFKNTERKQQWVDPEHSSNGRARPRAGGGGILAPLPTWHLGSLMLPRYATANICHIWWQIV